MLKSQAGNCLTESGRDLYDSRVLQGRADKVHDTKSGGAIHKKGKKHSEVMLTFLLEGVEKGGGATHQENGWLSPDKIVPPRRHKQSGDKLERDCGWLSGGGLLCASSLPRTAETKELWS